MNEKQGMPDRFKQHGIVQSRVPVNAREVRFMVSRLQGEQVNGLASNEQLVSIRALQHLALVFESSESAARRQ